MSFDASTRNSFVFPNRATGGALWGKLLPKGYVEPNWGDRQPSCGRDYIALGASMPSSQSPFASAWRVASTSASRALRTGSSEWITGQAW